MGRENSYGNDDIPVIISHSTVTISAPAEVQEQIPTATHVTRNGVPVAQVDHLFPANEFAPNAEAVPSNSLGNRINRSVRNIINRAQAPHLDILANMTAAMLLVHPPLLIRPLNRTQQPQNTQNPDDRNPQHHQDNITGRRNNNNQRHFG